MIRLTRVDLPTLGRPTTATTGTGPVVLERPRRSRSARSSHHPSCHAFTVQHFAEPGDDLVDAQLGGVQLDRVRRLPQRVWPCGSSRAGPGGPGPRRWRRRRRRSRRCAGPRGPPRRRSGRPSGRRRGRPPRRCRGPRPRSGRRWSMMARWCATSMVRTAGTADTAETAPVTSGPRISASTRDAVGGHVVALRVGADAQVDVGGDLGDRVGVGEVDAGCAAPPR